MTNNNKEKFKISTFLEEVKPVENLQKELDKKNPLLDHPEYIKIMKERGHYNG